MTLYELTTEELEGYCNDAKDTVLRELYMDNVITEKQFIMLSETMIINIKKVSWVSRFYRSLFEKKKNVKDHTVMMVSRLRPGDFWMKNEDGGDNVHFTNIEDDDDSDENDEVDENTVENISGEVIEETIPCKEMIEGAAKAITHRT